MPGVASVQISWLQSSELLLCVALAQPRQSLRETPAVTGLDSDRLVL